MDSLPSLYEYYTAGGITAGLSDAQPHFTLNNKNISIYSGALHYFRVPPEYWRDRLRKLRAAGLNTVETYVPWNLHEPQQGVYDFGAGGTDHEQFLHIEKFLKIAQEEDLLAIVRPGPYICSEWEFGGFPSWLLRNDAIKLRTSQAAYMQHVGNFFNKLLPILAMLQFTKGGPIIAFQVENEYGSTEQKGKFVPDKVYLEELRQIMLNNALVELLVTSDSPSMHGDRGTLPEYFLQTANFASSPEKEFDALKLYQRNKPTMAMEFWTGWFDHWSEQHHTRNNADYADVLERIITYPASFNLYMFHGGTNWGFMNGANIADGSTDNKGYQPDTTSYDYDAPLTEAGDYTEKYVILKKLLKKHETLRLRLPPTPSELQRVAYPSITINQQLFLKELIEQQPEHFVRSQLCSMEYLPMNNNSGQSYGYIVYRKKNVDLPANAVLKIEGRVCDSVMVLVDGVLVSKPLQTSQDLNGFGFWRLKDSTLNLGASMHHASTIELVVENWGRNNFGSLDQFVQRKGLWQGDVLVNGEPLSDWEIVPLDFKATWTRNLNKFHEIRSWMPQPALYKGVLHIAGPPSDTYIDMTLWTKGVVIVNGFVLGRYAKIGPQQAIYLPAPFLREGENDILIFEHYYAHSQIKFTENQIYKTL